MLQALHSCRQYGREIYDLCHLQEEAGLQGCLCYEDLIAAERPHLDRFQWVRVDENDACGLCYTSGTTGRPKVCYREHELSQ